MGTNKFNGLEKVNYPNIRRSIKTGDILLCSGDYCISKLIKYFSDSIFSHVAFVFHWNERILVFESVEDDGVRIIPLSQYIDNYENSKKPYQGQLFLARHKTGLSQLAINNMLGEATNLLNRNYGFADIVKIAWRIVTGLGEHKPNDEYICSEFVDKCFKEIGITLERGDSGFIYPEHIAADQNVEPLFELLT